MLFLPLWVEWIRDTDDIYIIHRIDEKVIWKLVYKETYQQYVGRPVRILSFIHSGIFDIFFYNLFWLFFDVFFICFFGYCFPSVKESIY